MIEICPATDPGRLWADKKMAEGAIPDDLAEAFAKAVLV
jgi:hypothetical protein